MHIFYKKGYRFLLQAGILLLASLILWLIWDKNCVNPENKILGLGSLACTTSAALIYVFLFDVWGDELGNVKSESGKRFLRIIAMWALIVGYIMSAMFAYDITENGEPVMRLLVAWNMCIAMSFMLYKIAIKHDWNRIVCAFFPLICLLPGFAVGASLVSSFIFIIVFFISNRRMRNNLFPVWEKEIARQMAKTMRVNKKDTEEIMSYEPEIAPTPEKEDWKDIEKQVKAEFQNYVLKEDGFPSNYSVYAYIKNANVSRFGQTISIDGGFTYKYYIGNKGVDETSDYVTKHTAECDADERYKKFVSDIEKICNRIIERHANNRTLWSVSVDIEFSINECSKDNVRIY